MKKLLILIPVVIISLSSMGCYGVDGNFHSIRNIALKEFGREFVTDTEFSLGSFELWILGGLAGMFEEDEVASAFIGSVSGVQIGVYNRKSRGDLPTANLLKKVDRQMKSKGWKYIVKSFEKNEMTAVYINKDSEKMLKELFVVSIDDSEMAIVHVSGDLEALIEAAIKEHGIRWNKEEGKRLASK